MPQFTAENQPENRRGKSKTTPLTRAINAKFKSKDGFFNHVAQLAKEGNGTCIQLIANELKGGR